MSTRIIHKLASHSIHFKHSFTSTTHKIPVPIAIKHIYIIIKHSKRLIRAVNGRRVPESTGTLEELPTTWYTEMTMSHINTYHQILTKLSSSISPYP
jgi:hypothetical protein